MSKICVVGGGRWGKNHIRTLNELGLLGGIVDVSPERQSEYAALYPSAKVFAELSEALAHDFKGFTLATPAETHYPVAIQILRAGYPVMVEKPLALSSSEARSLKDIARKYEQQLMVGHLMLFHPAIEKMKELLDADKIGKPQYVYSTRINLGTVRKEENILWSFAPHDVSIFQYLLESYPVEVIARGSAVLQPGIHDTTMTMLKYPGNISCHNFVSWLHPFKEHRIVVIGSKGMLSYEDSSENKQLLYYEKGIDWVKGEPITRDGATEVIAYDPASPLSRELQYFSDNCRGQIEKADADNAIEVLEILESATTSLQNEGEQVVPVSGRDSLRISASAKIGTSCRLHESCYVDDNVTIGAETSVWHFSHIQSDTTIGARCSFGQSVNVGNNVTIGDDCKIQNNVSIFEGVQIGNGVFCGPSMTFTNVLQPRAVFPQGSEGYARTVVGDGVTFGAHATIVCGNTIGRCAFIAAGAVVTGDVPPYAFMVGVPARRIGWATEGGERVANDATGTIRCGVSGKQYRVESEGLKEL